MKYHLSSATQRAKNVAFSGSTQPPNEPGNLVLVPQHRPQTVQDINTSTQRPDVLNPSTHHQRHEQMGFFGLLVLTFVVAVFLVFATYIVFHTLFRGYAPTFEDFAPQYAKKLQKRRPPPLELVAGGGDVEAQVVRLVAVGGVQAASVRRRSPVDFGEGWGDLLGTDVEGGTATGVDADGERLTPFSPARARARKYGEGDVEALGVDGVDELGSGRYFFGDGVGIMRYESTAEARGWKEG